MRVASTFCRCWVQECFQYPGHYSTLDGGASLQAQDSGESVRIMDDLMYALDGLNPRLPAATQHESAVAVAETALTQRGRMALRSEPFETHVASLGTFRALLHIALAQCACEPGMTVNRRQRRCAVFSFPQEALISSK